jgi:hypothetical protein
MLGAPKKKPPEGGFFDTARSSVNSGLLDGSGSGVSGLLGGVGGCIGCAAGCGSSVGHGSGRRRSGSSGSGRDFGRGSCSGAGRGRCGFLDSLNGRRRCSCRRWHFLFFTAGGEGSGSDDGCQDK